MTPSEPQQPERYLLYASQLYALAVLRPLQRAIRRQGGEAAWFFDGPGERFLRQDERLLRTVQEVHGFDPLAVFVPGNRVPDFFPGAKVEVFHGFSVGKRSDSRGHFRIRGFFDLYCTHGGTTTPQFRELEQRFGHFHVEETGWPKVDPLFDASNGADSAAWHWDDGRPLLLYASTFTERLSSARELHDTIRRLSESGPWNWLVTLHPKMPDEVVRSYRALEGPHLRFADTDDVIPLLRAADAMVSDTSSIVHEFLLLHKPVVTLRNTRPGPYLIDIQAPQGLEAAVTRALSRPPELMREIVEFAHLIHPFRDGKSSERVLDATRDFVERQRFRLKSKPLNLWRKIQMRHHLGYYRWR